VASGVQLVSAIIKHGIHHFKKLDTEMRQWLTDNEYESIDQLRGSMSLKNCPDPAAFSRTNYMKDPAWLECVGPGF